MPESIYKFHNGIDLQIEMEPRVRLLVQVPGTINGYNPVSSSSYTSGDALIGELEAHLDIKKADHVTIKNNKDFTLVIHPKDIHEAFLRYFDITSLLERCGVSGKKDAEDARKNALNYVREPEIRFVFFNHKAIQDIEVLANTANNAGYGPDFQMVLDALLKQRTPEAAAQLLEDVQTSPLPGMTRVFGALKMKPEARGYLEKLRDYQRDLNDQGILTDEEQFQQKHPIWLNDLYRGLDAERMPKEFIDKFIRDEIVPISPKTKHNILAAIDCLHGDRDKSAKYVGILNSQSFPKYVRSVTAFTPDHSKQKLKF